jgi:hypothetical protein
MKHPLARTGEGLRGPPQGRKRCQGPNPGYAIILLTIYVVCFSSSFLNSFAETGAFTPLFAGISSGVIPALP